MVCYLVACESIIAEEALDTIKDVIQVLYSISSTVPAYNDQSQQALIAYM